MHLTVIASGSKGNASLLELNGLAFLIDCGVSFSRLMAALKSRGLSPCDLAGVFITHEHTDHVRGLATLLSHFPVALYTRPRTFSALEKNLAAAENFQPIHDRLTLKNISVEAFSLLHDAADPVGYSFNGSEKFTIATDLGSVTHTVLSQIADADVLFLEANHDRALLMDGPYPWPLKQRILSPRGHLDNDAAAEALLHLVRLPKCVILGHMSEENNRPVLARQTVENILKRAGISLEKFSLRVLGQGEGTEISTD